MSSEHDTCPHCGVALRGDPIPGSRHGERYHRGIGVEIRGVYDGVLFYSCPACYGTWNRWDRDRDPRLWEKAEHHRDRFTRIMGRDAPDTP
ncbi:MAG: hypothetical protein ACRDTZ_01275 [Pseudonocardiaceae bacterium]